MFRRWEIKPLDLASRLLMRSKSSGSQGVLTTVELEDLDLPVEISREVETSLEIMELMAESIAHEVHQSELVVSNGSDKDRETWTLCAIETVWLAEDF